MSIIRKEQLSNPLSASYALTASYAENGGGSGSTFPYTGSAIITGSLTITGSLVVSQSIDSAQRILIRSTGNPAVNWQFNELYGTDNNTSINFGNYQMLTPGANNVLIWSDNTVAESEVYINNSWSNTLQQDLTQDIKVAGDVITAAVSSGSSQYGLVYLSGSIWMPTEQVVSTSTAMMGIALTIDESPTKGKVLLEGNITYDGSSGVIVFGGVTADSVGQPLYIREGRDHLSLIPPTQKIIRVMGHIYHYNTDNNGFIVKFKPSNDWFEIT